MLDPETDSKYKRLDVPEFKSTIPPHILAKLPESDRYLVEMVSLIEQRCGWLTKAAEDGNEANIELDIRTSKVERLIDRLTSKWSVVAFLISAVVLPIATKIFIERWLK